MSSCQLQAVCSLMLSCVTVEGSLAGDVTDLSEEADLMEVGQPV